VPTYEYRCADCRHQFELFQSIKDPVRRKCPKCGKLALKRLIGTGGGVIFKGSGFYATDYRSDSYKKAADAEKPKPAPDDKKSKPDKKE
jgi:putative FmdB family regulatory protein